MKFSKHGLRPWPYSTRKQRHITHKVTQKVERFDRDLKKIIAKLVNNDSAEWYQQVPPAMWSIRSSISSVTGYNLYFLLYGQEPRILLSRLHQSTDQNLINLFGNKLSDMTNAMQYARLNTQEARTYNRKILNSKASKQLIDVGDTVAVYAPEKLQFSSKWDPHNVVVRVRGACITVRNNKIGKIKIINRDHCKLVDPEIEWEEIEERPTRQRNPTQQKKSKVK